MRMSRLFSLALASTLAMTLAMTVALTVAFAAGAAASDPSSTEQETVREQPQERRISADRFTVHVVDAAKSDRLDGRAVRVELPPPEPLVAVRRPDGTLILRHGRPGAPEIVEESAEAPE